MRKGEAMIEVLRDVRNKRPSKTSRKRVERALRVLGVEGDDAQRVLYYLEYIDAHAYAPPAKADPPPEVNS